MSTGRWEWSSRAHTYGVPVFELDRAVDADGKEACPSCGARVRRYGGVLAVHPVGGIRVGAWSYCPGEWAET